MLSNVFEYHFKDHITNEEIRNRIQDAIGKHKNLLVIVQNACAYGMVVSQEPLAWPDSKRNMKTEEEMGRQHKGMHRAGVW